MSISEEITKLIKCEFAKQTSILREELSKVKEEIFLLRSNTKAQIESCEKRLSRVESELILIKRKTLKNNIIISGLKVEDSNLVHSALEQLNALLGINIDVKDINDIYRLGKGKPLIKIEFVSFLTKNLVIGSRHKLRGTQVFINQDLCEQDRENNKLLRQHLSLAKEKDYKAYIRAGSLFINGKKYSVDQLRGKSKVDTQSSSTQNEDEESRSQSAVDTNWSSSAPNSPAPVTRYKQMLTEHEHLQVEEDLRVNKEIASINQVLSKAKDWEELGRTRSQSSGSVKKGKNTKLTDIKQKKGG